MTQDVRPWLIEIKSLQEQLNALQQERDEAYASAANWRNLYETEAKQRRTDANLAQQKLGALQAEIQQMREFPTLGTDADTVSLIQREVNQMAGVQELQLALVRALTECDRLANTLKSEQTAHSQTRKSLTTALGDTVDLLAKERTAHKQRSKQPVNQQEPPKQKQPSLSVIATTAPIPISTAHVAAIATNAGSSFTQTEIKNPSLELPQLD